MNLNEYQIISRRTHQELSKTDLLVNSFLGVIGEYGEFLETSTIDEAGDIFFYLAMMCDSMDIEFSSILEIPIGSSKDTINWEIYRLSNEIKKIKYHQKNLTKETQSVILSFIANIYHIIKGYFEEEDYEDTERNMNRMMGFNINKLKERYPNGFHIIRSDNESKSCS